MRNNRRKALPTRLTQSKSARWTTVNASRKSKLNSSWAYEDWDDGELIDGPRPLEDICESLESWLYNELRRKGTPLLGRLEDVDVEITCYEFKRQEYQVDVEVTGIPTYDDYLEDPSILEDQTRNQQVAAQTTKIQEISMILYDEHMYESWDCYGISFETDGTYMRASATLKCEVDQAAVKDAANRARRDLELEEREEERLRYSDLL